MLKKYYLHVCTCCALACVVLLTASCSSPLDLDVDRTVNTIDHKFSPTRMSLFYYFGNEGYEAIVVDTNLLKTIIIDKSVYSDTYECTVTIPQFLFTLSDDLNDTLAVRPYSPFVRAFSFSTLAQPADGNYRNSVGNTSWMACEYLDIDNSIKRVNWPANNAGKEIRIGFYTVKGENLVKGFAQIIIINPAPADPTKPEFVAYNALITMEFDERYSY